uniref:Uncharacterized protein n=1 Tax=Pectinophora gossypiella TaxID=13191 RepID=A0A1E1WJP8_PECGO
MTLSKPVTTQNVPAFSKRWRAALASQNITDLIPATAWDTITAVAMVFHNIVNGKPDLRQEIFEDAEDSKDRPRECYLVSNKISMGVLILESGGLHGSLHKITLSSTRDPCSARSSHRIA